MDIKQTIKNNRQAIKPSWKSLRSIETDRNLNKKRPDMFKEIKTDTIIDLDKEFPLIVQKTLSQVIESRASLRQYADASLSFSELSYILWETARVKRTFKSAVFRTIPTGGATNAMETYVFVNGVEGIEKGLYLYLQNKHQLALIDADSSLEDRVNQALYQQLRGAQMVLFFTAVPYRSEYKYSFAAHKMIAMEAGHAGQNASLSAEVIDCGACCLAAYNQDLCDLLLQVDGEQEFTTYAITIGKKVE